MCSVVALPVRGAAPSWYSRSCRSFQRRGSSGAAVHCQSFSSHVLKLVLPTMPEQSFASSSWVAGGSASAGRSAVLSSAAASAGRLVLRWSGRGRAR
jgi:hypothetical protein